jgi:uncharacterized repeat protein (TIGR03943 family)
VTVRIERLRVVSNRRRVDVAHYAPSFLLAGYGLFVLSLYLRNDLNLYINPMYTWPTVAAGVVLLMVSAVRLMGTRTLACGHGGGDGCACTQPSVRLWPFLALSVPLLLAALIPPQSLAGFSALQRGPQLAGVAAIQGVGSVRHVSLSVDTKTFTMQDWVGALSADPNPKDYDGKPIVLSGIVVHDPASVPPGYIMVIRYQVTCCIADARPVGLIVKDNSHGALKDNQWVLLTGVMGQTRYQGDAIPVVEPRTMKVIKAGDPYMY